MDRTATRTEAARASTEPAIEIAGESLTSIASSSKKLALQRSRRSRSPERFWRSDASVRTPRGCFNGAGDRDRRRVGPFHQVLRADLVASTEPAIEIAG